MTPIESYFQKILVINRAARTDRWEQVLGEMSKAGITKFERFDAYDHGGVDGNAGCTASHRAVLDVIAFFRWPRTLVLEDDFQIIHDDFQFRFESMVKEVPETWQMIYLGGHYGNPPRSRVSKHVILMSQMLTTSSYGITWQQARKMAPHICGAGPIDALYSNFTQKDECYIFQPRLIVQRESFSDLQGYVMNNAPCMQDTRHENMV